MTGHCLASSALSFLKPSCPAGSSSSEKIASTGHSGSHSVQSMHSSGSMVRKFGPSWKQSTGHTSTQSMYLHLMQFSVTTKVIRNPRESAGPRRRAHSTGGRASSVLCHAPCAAVKSLPRGRVSVQGREVVTLAPGGLVFQVTAQRKVGAAEGDVCPG